MIGVVLLLAVLAGGGYVAMRSLGGTAAAGPAPSPSPPGLVQTVPESYTVPGTPPQLPWPTAGQSAVEVQDVGMIGTAGSQTAVPIASVTKVMTAYVVLTDHPLAATEPGPNITVSQDEAAAYPAQVAAGDSLVKVTAGEVLTERQALIALLLPSADNIALVLARWDAGGVPAFVDKMNATATALGMTSTRYDDPAGLARTTVSTATDQIKLAEKALTLPALAQIVGLSSAKIPVAGTVTNYNTALGHEGIIGIKTGSTSAAGGCLLFAARRTVSGRVFTVIGAVFGQSGTTLNGLPKAISASQQLVHAAAAAVQPYTVVAAGAKVATVGGKGLVAASDVTALGWPGLAFKVSVQVRDPAAGIGSATVELDGAGTPVTVGAIEG